MVVVVVRGSVYFPDVSVRKVVPEQALRCSYVIKLGVMPIMIDGKPYLTSGRSAAIRLNLAVIHMTYVAHRLATSWPTASIPDLTFDQHAAFDLLM